MQYPEYSQPGLIIVTFACMGSLPCWPDRTTIHKTMPADFKELYPNTTAIVDATEI